jgi:hypothetical protein
MPLRARAAVETLGLTGGDTRAVGMCVEGENAQLAETWI